MNAPATTPEDAYFETLLRAMHVAMRVQKTSLPNGLPNDQQIAMGMIATCRRGIDLVPPGTAVACTSDRRDVAAAMAATDGNVLVGLSRRGSPFVFVEIMTTCVNDEQLLRSFNLTELAHHMLAMARALGWPPGDELMEAVNGAVMSRPPRGFAN